MFGLFGKSSSDMVLFVGLGNPGDKYQGNRHNVGFWVIDEIASDHLFPAFKSKFQGEFSEGRIGKLKIGLLKPQTYMNESGRSVAAAAKFYKIPPERIIVFHDELDIQPAQLRTKMGGGNAGHNGLKSIQAHLGTADFIRVRIGIGHPGDKNKVSNYVLSDFAKAEKPAIEALVSKIAAEPLAILDEFN